MALPLWIDNLIAYSLQIAILAAAGTLLAYIFRLRFPRVSLIYWQVLLLACLALPVLQKWERPAAVSTPPAIQIMEMTVSNTGAVSELPSESKISITDTAVLIFAAGALLRLLWLALGFYRLCLLLRRSERIERMPAFAERIESLIGVRARFYMSDETDSPATFGIFNPTVILPRTFPEMREACREAILCHELLHVRRRDWALIFIEEMIRTIFWFHPAVWWLLSRIHLTREQSVDHEVVKLTGNRQPYLDSLLEIARKRGRPKAVPAPLFLRERHLVERVALLIKEVSMNRLRLALSLVAVFALLAGTVHFAAAWFPLTGSADPEMNEPSKDPLRIGENDLQSKLIRKVHPAYPEEAREAGVTGQVTLDITVNEKGEVTDVKVLDGHPLLIDSSMEAVRQYKVSPTLLNGASTQVIATVTVNYDEETTGTKNEAQQVQTLAARSDPTQASTAQTKIVPQPIRLMQPTGGESNGKFELHYSDADLRPFIQQISELLGLTPLIIDPKVQGTATVHSSEPISKSEVLNLFHLTLKNNSASLIKQNGIYLVVPISSELNTDIDIIEHQSQDAKSETPPENSETASQKEGGVYGGIVGGIPGGVVGGVTVVPGVAGSGGGIGSGEGAGVGPGEVAVIGSFGSNSTGIRNFGSFRSNSALGRMDSTQSTGTESDSSQQAPKRIGVNVLQSKLIRRVEPDYPEEAKGGQVVLNVTVNEKGDVTNVEVLDGDPLHIDSVVAAVKQWKYEPILLNGTPVPVIGTVTVKRNLVMPTQFVSPTEIPINPNPENAEWIDGNVLQSKLIHKVDPEYPELAKRARVQGKVNLAVTVDEEGHVSNVEVIGGHPMLLIAAEKAVKQWKYQPTLLNGKAIPVVAFVRVNFVLPEDTEADAPAGELRNPNVIIVSLDESGKVAINKEPVSIENLGRELQKLFRERPDKILFLRVPANVNYSEVKKIVDIAKGAGAGEIGLITDEIR